MVRIGGRLSVLDEMLKDPCADNADELREERDALADLKAYIDRAFDSLPHVEAPMAKYAFYIDWDTPHARIQRYSQFQRWKWLNKVCASIDPNELGVRWTRASKYLIKEGRNESERNKRY